MVVVVPFGVQILTQCKSFNELLELSQVKTSEAVVGNSVVQLLWITMIDGYAGWGNSSDAMELFDENGVEPNEVTMIAVLSACSSKGDVGMGKEMYVKCGCLAAAREVFDDRKVRDVFTWTSMVMDMLNQTLQDGFTDDMPEKNVVSWS
ncbi:hypothetical protein ACLB2K_020807 [Fragaria x ananassa]